MGDQMAGHKDVLKAVRQLYNRNDWARAIFDRLADLKRNPQETPIERWVNSLGETTTVVIDYARQMQETGCGTFVVGRRGSKSRFKWHYNAISLGRAASGATDELIDADENVESETDEEVSATASAAETPLTLTILQAKEALARTLGVKPEQIEITVKA